LINLTLPYLQAEVVGFFRVAPYAELSVISCAEEEPPRLVKPPRVLGMSTKVKIKLYLILCLIKTSEGHLELCNHST